MITKNIVRYFDWKVSHIKGGSMTKVKKIILGVSIALSMCVALVVGLISTPKTLFSGEGTINSNKWI